MSKTPDTKPAASDPLLILVAALLLLAVAATIYFSATGPAKEFTKEPATHQRPIIQDEPRVVVVTKAVAGGTAEGAVAQGGEAKAEAKPAEAKPAEAKPAVPVAAVAAAPVVKPSADGKVHGKVVLKGTPPPEKPIGAAKADINCGKAHPNDTPTSRNYVVAADGGLRYALVRVVNAPAGGAIPADKPVVNQTGCMYEPYVNAVMVGQTFVIQNSDSFLHNVLATPKVNKGFNFAQATQGQTNEKSFDKPEIAVKFACSVHPWMSSYMHVLENPYFAVTNDKGEFTLPDGLPAGKYTLEVNHLKAGTVTVEIEVGAGKGAEVTAELAVK